MAPVHHVTEAAPRPVLAFVSGTVRSENGAPLGGATVALFEPGTTGRLIKSLKTDVQGKFNAGVAPGAYHMRAEADGHKARFTRVNLDRSRNLTFDFALRRVDTLVEKRGDRDDWRWIGRSVPRSVLHWDEDESTWNPPAPAEVATANATSNALRARGEFHGVTQLFGYSGQRGAGFAGANFAVSGAVSKNVEVAMIGQAGMGPGAPQRLSLVTSLRAGDNHHITTGLGYGRMGMFANAGAAQKGTLEQASLSVIDEWQAFRPLLIVYGVDYSRFTGGPGRGRASLLPRIAVQYTPNAKSHIRAAITSLRGFTQQPEEGLKSENIDGALMPEAAFGPARQPETAFAGGQPVMDRSRRYEAGYEHLFADGAASLEATAFYYVISGHGVGVLALPLEATPAMQAAMQQVAQQVVAMNGAARGMRVMYSRRLGAYVTAGAGYSFGRGQRYGRDVASALAAAGDLRPGQMFEGGFFQAGAARLSLDLKRQTGTTVSTVVRLSPEAVVFAIDPFAGRMSVYDPNVSVYITQNLPTFGLPLRCQAIVDVRNLLNQSMGVEDLSAQLITARSQRTVRGGIALRW
ncbi:MAG: carboxypeptidase regulatory-like domain-containing protein [Blastocatellia bacterium]